MTNLIYCSDFITTVDEVLDKLTPFCKQAVIETGVPEFEYQYPGTATCLKVNGRQFLITTYHQLRETNIRTTSIVTPDLKHLISPTIIFRPTPPVGCETDDEYDLLLFEFTQTFDEVPELKSDFFVVSEKNIWLGDPDPPFFALGFPTKGQKYDYPEPRFTAQQWHFAADYVGPTASPNTHKLQVRGKPFYADGMSGGPVFHLEVVDNVPIVWFSGIVVRGGNPSNILHFVDARRVIGCCIGAIKGDAQQSSLPVGQLQG